MKRETRNRFNSWNSAPMQGEERASMMRGAVLGIFDIVEALYPYDFNLKEKRKMPMLMDLDRAKDHFLYCLKSYEEGNGIVLENKFIEPLFELLFERFYSCFEDNYENTRDYLSYLVNPNSSRTENDVKDYMKLYNSFSVTI